jgi:hypothetical protein
MVRKREFLQLLEHLIKFNSAKQAWDVV